MFHIVSYQHVLLITEVERKMQNILITVFLKLCLTRQSVGAVELGAFHVANVNARTDKDV